MTRLLSFAGSAAIAVAALLASANDTQAQHRGGFGGGAYHGGMGGAPHAHGGSWGGYHGGNWNGYHGHGGYYGGYGRYGYGWGYPGFGLYLGLGGLGYGGYGYPYYGGGYYGGDYAYSPNYYNYAPGYAAPPDYGYGVQTQSAYAPSASTARLVVQVPPEAQVWVEDQLMQQAGPVRQMLSPPVLEPGKTYHYTVKAQWNANGQPVTQERMVNVMGGQTATVDFNQPQANPPATAPNPMPTPPANPPAGAAPTNPSTGNIPATPPAPAAPPNPVPPPATPPAKPNPPTR